MPSSAQFSHGPSKVAKQIRKKKGANSTSSLHANSRDARKLNKATLRDEKLWRNALLRDRANEKYLSRVEFFKQAAQSVLDTSSSSGRADDSLATESSSPIFDADLLSRLITTYLSRHSEELSTLVSARRPGRPASTREDSLRDTIKEENDELASGYWMPDLRDRSTVEDLRLRWDGGWSSLGNLKWIRLSRGKDGSLGVRESSFPPKGKA